MLDERALKDAAARLLALVKKADPQAQALVSLNGYHSAHTRFAHNTVTTTGDVDQASVHLGVQLAQRAAGASSNQTDPASLAALVRRTVQMARLAPLDPEAMPVLGPQKVARTPAQDAAVGAMDPAARARAVREALEAGKARQLEVAGFIEHTSGTVVRASSAGLLVAQPYSDLSFSVTARTSDGTGSGWASGTSRRLAEVDFAQLARAACDKAARSRAPTALAPGRYTVVLEPAAVHALVDAVVGSADQRAADEGRSPFSTAGGGTRVGEKLFSELVTIASRPASRVAPTFPFDGEGFPLPERTWVSKGVLASLAVSRFWAKKKGVPPTGAYSGFELLPGTSSRAELIRGVERGVLVTRLWYTNLIDARTLALTGLTRDGTFLIEKGEVTRPVNNFRFNQSVLEALARVDGVSSELSSWGSSEVRVPSLRTHDFLLASKSDAV